MLVNRLCGYHPFDPEGECSDNEMIGNIKACKFTFDDDGWAAISAGAKDLVRHLLVLDPEERYSMAQVLAHPWICRDEASPPSELPLSPTIHRDLANYRKQAKARTHVRAGQVWSLLAVGCANVWLLTWSAWLRVVRRRRRCRHVMTPSTRLDRSRCA